MHNFWVKYARPYCAVILFYIFKVLILVRPEGFMMRDKILIQGTQVALWWLILTHSLTLISTSFFANSFSSTSHTNLIWWLIFNHILSNYFVNSPKDFNFLDKLFTQIQVSPSRYFPPWLLFRLLLLIRSSAHLTAEDILVIVASWISPEMFCLEIKLPRFLPIVASSVQHHALLDQQWVVIGVPEEKDDIWIKIFRIM